MDFARLWLHEASRVYGDKMIDTKDMENFKKMKFEICKQFFDVSVQNIVATLGTSMTKILYVCGCTCTYKRHFVYMPCIYM